MKNTKQILNPKQRTFLRVCLFESSLITPSRNAPSRHLIYAVIIYVSRHLLGFIYPLGLFIRKNFSIPDVLSVVLSAPFDNDRNFKKA